jgi:hypothetical protein
MSTKSGIRWLQDHTVVLPNGRNVVLASKEGADEFVDTFGADFISTNLTAADSQELAYAYAIMVTFAKNASPEKIVSGIPESELRTFIEHTQDTLRTASSDRNWLRSGTVSVGYQTLLQAVAVFSGHPSFLVLFLSNEGMEAVAKFYASRKKNETPNHRVAKSILLLAANILRVLAQDGASFEKVLGTMEKAGLLGQLIRCVPVDPEFSSPIVNCLQTCLQLVKKKLKSGTRTGDILDAVMAGKDGPINEKAKSALSRLQSLARLSNSNDSNDYKRVMLNKCNHCDKFETLMNSAKLMKCKRCKATYYCSKECQVADWKSHKKTCHDDGSGDDRKSGFKTSKATMWAFVESTYFDIVKEVYRKTQEYNISKTELFVEIDFYGDAPALRNEFKVWLTSGLFEGSSVADAPEWFRTDADKKTLANGLREEYEQVTRDHLLAVCRAGNGNVFVHFLEATNAGYQIFSDEAVESIGREDYTRMVACLGPTITHRYFEERSGLT